MKIEATPNSVLRIEMSIIEAQHLVSNMGDIPQRICGQKLRQVHKQMFATLKLMRSLGADDAPVIEREVNHGGEQETDHLQEATHHS